MLRPYITPVRLPPNRGRRLSRRFSRRCFEKRRKEDQDCSCEYSRQDPETSPLLKRQTGGRAKEAVVYASRHLRPDQHADAVGDQDQETLRLATNRRRGLLVHVDLPGDEEEIVARAV